MKKKIIILLFFISLKLSAQQLLSSNRYIIYLSDKNNNQYSLSNPQQFLSSKAILRRANQNINIATNDLPVTNAYIDSIKNTGAKILLNSKWLNYVCVQISDSTQLIAIMQFPFVTSNKLVNRVGALHDVATNNDKFKIENRNNNPKKINKISSLDTSIIYGPSFTQINQIGGDALHNLNYKGQGIGIAVFDSGFPNVNTISAFDSLRTNNRILGYYNFVDDTSDVFNPTYNNHGTNTLSCMAAWEEGQLVGTAPRASYYLFMTENVASETPYEEVCWVSAAELADSLGVDIISSSLGYTTFDNSTSNYTNADMDGNTAICTKGADIAASKGLLVVSSAGNSGSSPWQIISAPSDGDSVLCIGAVNSFGQRATFSSLGPSADGRFKPDVCALGEGAIIANTNGGFQSANGTSFSCPILAGMAACLWQANPTLTNMEVASAIKESASQFNNPDNFLGYGIPNFSNALFLITKTKYSQVINTKIENIFPVPFNDKLNVIYHSLDTENISITISDITGNKILAKNFRATTNAQNLFVIEKLDNLKQGIYLLNLRNSKENITQKVIKLY
jgi:hypothetical protein